MLTLVNLNVKYYVDNVNLRTESYIQLCVLTSVLKISEHDFFTTFANTTNIYFMTECVMKSTNYFLKIPVWNTNVWKIHFCTISVGYSLWRARTGIGG